MRRSAPTACAAQSKSGQPCQAYPIAGSRYCFAHDPERAGDRADARRRGALVHNQRTPALKLSHLDLKTPAGLLAFAEEVMRATCNHGLSIERSRALGYLMLAQKRFLELSSLAARLHAVEATLQKMQGQPDAPVEDPFAEYAKYSDDELSAMLALAEGPGSPEWLKLEAEHGPLSQDDLIAMVPEAERADIVEELEFAKSPAHGKVSR